jgi:EAL domain-containing protein (putative c-di-GMP-specific phosphodiesterase class I)
MSDRTFRLSASDIDNAFERNEFRVVFQPKIDLASERVTGAEVFVRWQHPQYGLLPPGLFLDFIEANGRMPDLTGFVFHAALDGCKRWKTQGKDWTVSINVAPGTVTAEGFCEGLAKLLQEYGLEPGRIIIEVPERAIAQEPETLCEALLEVREMGVHVALDGGGIVPVDLAQFVPMPFTSIKVGGPASIRLAQRLGLRGKGAIAARLRFAHLYNLDAVAVGAEDEATMQGLADVGFTAAQGIWIQKPMPLEDLLKWNGTWARGRVSMDPMPAPVPAKASRPAEPKGEPDKAADGVRAKRASVPPVLQPKPQQKVMPTLPAMEMSDLEDIVEDEEASAPQVKRQGFGAPAEGCPPMKGLVQRKTRKGSLQDLA